MPKPKPNSIYWQKKADKEVSKYYKGQPCVVCGKTYMTCGHHVVPKSISAYYRHHPLNIIPLCTGHHKFSNDLAAHSKNPLAVEAFLNWLRKHKPKTAGLLDTYKQHRNSIVDYQQSYYEWKELNQC